LEHGTCHTLWHRLDIDFVSDHSDTGRLSAYTGGPCWSVDRRTHRRIQGALRARDGECRFPDARSGRGICRNHRLSSRRKSSRCAASSFPAATSWS